eukprot:COSAG03_NODE_18354_length_357_cov_0.472868_1_plen_80_part_10
MKFWRQRECEIHFVPLQSPLEIVAFGPAGSCPDRSKQPPIACRCSLAASWVSAVAIVEIPAYSPRNCRRLSKGEMPVSPS